MRLRRMAKAVYELKYSDAPIVDIALKYDYDSQESFTRIFKNAFGVTPGAHRNSGAVIEPVEYHLARALHEESHNAVEKGLWIKQNVQSWIINQPARIWASARRNHEDLSLNEFYGLCGREGVMNKTGALPDILIEGGAILTMERGNNQLCFGVEVADDYPVSLLAGFEIFHIPPTEYVVFNVPPYDKEAHGSAVESIWSAQKSYDLTEHSLEWNYGEAPIIEADSKDFGYTMWFPAKPILEVKSDETKKQNLKKYMSLCL